MFNIGAYLPMSFYHICLVGLCVPLTLILGLLPEAQAEDSIPSVKKVVEEYQTACDAISSFDIYVKITLHGLVGPGPKDSILQYIKKESTTTTVYHHSFSLGRSRIELIESSSNRLPPNSKVTVWDGTVGKEYDAARNRGIINAYGPDINTTRFTFTYLEPILGSSFVRLIGERLPHCTSVERQGRYLVLSIAADPERFVSLPNIAYRLFLDMDRGMLPDRIDQLRYQDGESRLFSQFKNELTEVQSGLWIPHRSRQTVFETNKKSNFFGQEIAWEELEVDLARSRFNEPVDEAAFSVIFPAGTDVTDYLSSTTYRVGMETRESYLNQLARLGRLSVEDLKQAQPRLGYKTVISSRSILLWINLAILGVVLAILGFRFFRRLRASR